MCGQPLAQASNPMTLPGYETSGYTISFGCFYTAEYCHQDGNGWGVEFAPALRVKDDHAPANVGASGPVRDQDPITSASLNIDATDRGLGVHRADVLVDGTLVRSAEFPGPACNDLDPGAGFAFSAGRPCLLSPPSLAIDLAAQLPEGMHDIEARVLDAAGNTRGVFSRRAMIDRLPDPTVIKPPSINGKPKRPEWLTAMPGTWDGNGYPLSQKKQYAWQRCDLNGLECSTIVDAASDRYKLDAPDVGKRLRVLVTASSPGGSTQVASDLTEPIQQDDRCGGRPCDEIWVDFEDLHGGRTGLARAARRS